MRKLINGDACLAHRARLLGMASAATLAFLSLPQAAQAQTKIEQMIVTAQKRSQDIQTVPASISAFSGESLEERQIKNIQDLTSAAPNISLSTAAGSTIPQLSIRGVAADGSTPGMDQPVALHIDGVYQPRTIGLNLIMTDLEGVEILRGPQGTLYGRNANAGVINLVTKKPTDVFEGSATVFGGSWGRYGARGYVSGPITENISARLTAMVDRSSGYGKNYYTGNDVNGSNAYGARLAVRMTPVEDVTVDLSLTRTFDHSTTPRYVTSGIAPALSGTNYNTVVARGFDARYTTDPHRVFATFDAELMSQLTAAAATINWDITPEISLKSITGWQRTGSHSLFDADAMVVNYINSANSLDSRTFSQEFNLNAKLWDRLDAVVGVYFMYDKMYNPGFNIPFPQGNPVGTPATAGLEAHFYFPTEQAKTRAAFIDLNFSVLDNLRLVGGVRRTLDHKATVYDNQSILRGANITPGCGPFRVVPAQDYHSTTGKLGIQYDITPDIMAYVQWQNGFKTGGYNPSLCNNAYLPEHIYSWEGGIKSTLFDGSTTLNISYFHYKYANLQMFRTIPPGLFPTSTSVLDNAASAKIQGVEIEANSYLTDDLRANIGVGILDSEFGNVSSINPLGVATPVSIQGNTLPRAPKLTLNAGLEYTMRIGNVGELKSRGEYSYTSRTWFSIFNEPISRQDGYSLFNAIFTFTPDDSCLTYQVYARNLTDKDYRLSAYPSATLRYATGAWGAPRTFGAEVTAKF